MCLQPNSPCPITPLDRPPITFMARALEKTLDDLPTNSPWWTRLDRLHEEIADGLEPDA